MSTLIAIALSFWLSLGAIFVPEIQTRDENIQRLEAVPASTDILQPCIIHIYPLFYQQDYTIQLLIIEHEVGHCLGLQHIDSPGIMNLVLWPNTVFTDADKTEYYRVHPEPNFHLIIMEVSRN